MTTLLTRDPVTSVIPPDFGEDARYEIVDGQYVELPPMSTIAGRIATVLVYHLEVHAVAHALGRAVSDTLFPLSSEIRLWRCPDAAFVSYGRWPKNRPLPHTDPWPVVPDLAVEVVSPTDQAEALLKKLSEYFRAGVRLVWVVYPMLRMAYVYDSLTQVRGLTESDQLDGGTVLPEFRLALSSLFVDVPPPEPTNGSKP